MQPLQSIHQLTLPPQIDCRLQELLGRQAEGKLSESQGQELDSLIEFKATLALVRTKAKAILDTVPPAPSRLGQTVRNGLPVMMVPSGTPAIDPEAVRRFLQESVF